MPIYDLDLRYNLPAPVMLIDAVAAPLSLLAVALPFLFGVTEPPSPNFWSLIVSWTCGAVLAALALQRAVWGRQSGSFPDGATATAAQVALGLLLAAIVGSVVGLIQYFLGDAGLSPWVQVSTHGQAMGNLRQRNQQATLLALGIWALLWVVAQLQTQFSGSGASKASSAMAALISGGRRWPSWMVGMLIAWTLALIAFGSAATASRTGALEWALIILLMVVWRASSGRLALGLAVAGMVIYSVAAWMLPWTLLQWTGFQTDGLFARFTENSHACTSRRVLWTNMLHLISQKPWTGWGWGELDYAHYVTLFPGERFCVLLDNAHNLPLHLAVELGLPLAVLACGLATVVFLRARPWREKNPVRQLAWGILAIIGLHSMLEFPLWYGPFQVIALTAVLLLWPRSSRSGRLSKPRAVAAAAAIVALVISCGLAAADYYRVSQLFKPAANRAAAYRDSVETKVTQSPLFGNHIEFAWLTTTPLTRANAPTIYEHATALLHYSPEPRVIEPLIESAVMLGKDDVAAFHIQRYRIAYPDDYGRWQRANKKDMPLHARPSSAPTAP